MASFDIDRLEQMIKAGGVVSYTPGSLPPPGAGYKNQIAVVTSPGQPTQVMICVPNSGGGWEWIILQQSS